MQPVQAAKVDIPSIHEVDGTSLGYPSISSACASCSLPSEIRIKLGMSPRRSSNVCIFTADFVDRKCAHGNTDKQRSMVVGIQRVDGVLQVQPEVLTGIQLPRLDDQCLRRGRVDTPVPRLVGIGQSSERRTGSPKAHVPARRRAGLRAGHRPDGRQAWRAPELPGKIRPRR